MRIAVISDVHGNLEALQATLGAIAGGSFDHVWSLGDVVGYGARPSACMDLVRDHCDVRLAGNHDLVAAGVESAEDFSRPARVAISWTAQQLSAAERSELAASPSAVEEHGIGIVHGSIRDPVREYVVDASTARACLADQTQQVVLVGHSHIALSWQLDDLSEAGASVTRRGDGERICFGDHLWILNPGSVGQPRDRDPRASWLELDLGAGTATWHRTAYDVASAQAAIRNAGLPESLADRLGAGR